MALNVSPQNSLEEVLALIKDAKEKELELVIDSASPLVKNPLNWLILEKLANQAGKDIKLSEKTASGDVVAISEEAIEDNLGFVEASDALAAASAQKTEAQVGVGETIPQESETLKLTAEPPPLINTRPPFMMTPDSPEEATAAEGDGVEKTGLLPFKGLPTINLAILKNIKMNRRNGIIGAVGLLFLIIVFGLFFYLPSATVKLYVEAQDYQKEATISATPRLSEIDVNSASIPLAPVEVKQSGSLSTRVSGKKNIGDPAKGKVTIRNYLTTSSKSLAKGTTVAVLGKSPALEFNLDRAVTIPSGSASSSIDSSGRLVSVIDPGRVDVEATAAKIGTDGNILGSTRLSVSGESLSVLDAIAAGDFSGGTTKEVTVVSASDRNNLLATLSAELTEKAKAEVESKLTEGQKLPDGGIETEVVKRTFSKDIDQEATELNLNLEVIARANVYNEKDLARLMVEATKDSLPEGYKVSDADTQATAQVLSLNEDKTVTLVSKITTKLVPDLKVDDLAANLQGKSVEAATDYLKNLKNIHDMEIELRPAFLSFIKNLPRDSKKIKIEIIAREK